jgi:signal transduction histidine kinase
VLLGRRRLMMLGSIAMSCGLTAIMSLIFNRTIRGDMMVTGFVCAVVIDRIINRISGNFRRKLARANQLLSQRVREAVGAEQALRDELISRDRMAQAGLLAAGVSHEIRSPLSVIAIAACEVPEMCELPADARQMLADIEQAAASINVILKDLSSIARPVDDPLGPIELSTVVASAARLAAYRLGPTTRLVREDLEVPKVVANAPRLVQLLLNLIVNATRATRPDAPNAIRVAAKSTADKVILEISDTGCGMSAETLAKIFEPYFTTGQTTGGTGLGLPICKSIVEKMGGAIDVQSTLGLGTSVYVTLRRAP